MGYKFWHKGLFHFFIFLLVIGFSQTVRADENSKVSADSPQCKMVSEIEADYTETCFYPHSALYEVYEKIKSSIANKGRFFKEEAFHKKKSQYKEVVHWVNPIGTPMESSADVTYEWVKKNKLKIIVDQNSEVATFIFEETKGGTKFTQIVKTAY